MTQDVRKDQSGGGSGQSAGGPNAPGHTAIFLHIPKTAGQTLTAIVKRLYGKGETIWLRQPRIADSIAEFQALSDGDRRKLKFVLGHVGYGLHTMTPNRCTYVTVLRDPIDRVISYYYYIRRTPVHFLYEDATKLSLKDFAASQTSHKLSNGMTKYLAELDAKECTDETFATAKRNVESFAVTGLIERFDETLMLMKRALGWNMPFYERENVTRNRPQKTEVGTDVRDTIAKYNHYDVELYEWAKKRYEETVAAAGLGLKTQVAGFRALNRAWAPARSLWLKTKGVQPTTVTGVPKNEAAKAQGV